MSNWLERTELILGPKEMDRLKSAHVMIVGLGGIGSFAGENDGGERMAGLAFHRLS